MKAPPSLQLAISWNYHQDRRSKQHRSLPRATFYRSMISIPIVPNCARSKCVARLCNSNMCSNCGHPGLPECVTCKDQGCKARSHAMPYDQKLCTHVPSMELPKAENTKGRSRVRAMLACPSGRRYYLHQRRYSEAIVCSNSCTSRRLVASRRPSC